MERLVRSFRSEASARYAAILAPGRYSTPTTSPASGERFTWTSSGDRKMETAWAGPTNGSSATGPTAITLPSAGARMARGVVGAARSGSRKKNTMKAASAARPRAVLIHPAHVRSAASASGTRMNPQPSAAIGSIRSDIRGRRLSHPRRLDPAHHRAESLADLLDLVVRLGAPRGEEARAVRLVLEHPLSRELAALDLLQDLLHLGADVIVDHAGPAAVVTELRGVGHRVAHVREPALVEQVDDQLQLVHALEVGDLGLVARLDERLKGRLAQDRAA